MSDNITPCGSDDSFNEGKEEISPNLKFLPLTRLSKTLSLNSSSAGSSTNSSRNASFSHLHEIKEYFDYNSINDSIYPVLIPDKQSKKKAKKLDSNEICSPGLESPVKEETAEKEDDLSHKILKQVPIFSDGEEFNEKITRFSHRRKGRGLEFPMTSVRCRSSETSHLPLHKVQESKAEDDYPRIPRKTKFYLENILDMNEFNNSNMKQKILKVKKSDVEVESNLTDRSFSRRISNQVNDGETIPEDFIQENKENPEMVLPSFSSGPSSSSPRYKLKMDKKVDELEMNVKEKKHFDSFPLEEPILEETVAEEGQENSLLQAAKSKLRNEKEKELMMKLIKSESIDESDCVRTTAIVVEKEINILENEPIQEVEEEKINFNE